MKTWDRVENIFHLSLFYAIDLILALLAKNQWESSKHSTIKCKFVHRCKWKMSLIPLFTITIRFLFREEDRQSFRSAPKLSQSAGQLSNFSGLRWAVRLECKWGNGLYSVCSRLQQQICSMQNMFSLNLQYFTFFLQPVS